MFSDHLGSATLAVNDTGTAKTGILRYTSWGETRYSEGTTPTNRRYTGQYEEAELGLYFYGARWVDPYLNRFLSPDDIIPDPTNPIDFDRYAFVRNNPVNYSDPSGHDPYWCGGNQNCYQYHYSQMGFGNCYSDCKNEGRQDYVFSRTLTGSNPDGSWTIEDWTYYYENTQGLYSGDVQWKGETPGWETFAKHVDNLAAHYGPNERNIFVRDLGLLYTGMSSTDPIPVALVAMARGPKQRFLKEGNQGLDQAFIDSKLPRDNQSHHYVGIFVLSYYEGVDLAANMNYLRDTDNPGDIALGQAAAVQGTLYREGMIDFLGRAILGFLTPR
jgi:RHS repeat-associated protein